MYVFYQCELKSYHANGRRRYQEMDEQYRFVGVYQIDGQVQHTIMVLDQLAQIVRRNSSSTIWSNSFKIGQFQSILYDLKVSA